MQIATAVGGFSCSGGIPGIRVSDQLFSTLTLVQIIYVTGGEELTIISTAASATMYNVRIEVVSYTKLILDIPDCTVTGIFQSVRVVPTVFFPHIQQTLLN